MKRVLRALCVDQMEPVRASRALLGALGRGSGGGGARRRVVRSRRGAGDREGDEDTRDRAAGLQEPPYRAHHDGTRSQASCREGARDASERSEGVAFVCAAEGIAFAAARGAVFATA